MKKPLTGRAALIAALVILPTSIFGTTGARAADATMPDQHSRFYFAFHGGAVFPGKTYDDVGPPVSGQIQVDGNNGWMFGVAVGKMLNPNIAIEGEVTHLRADPKSAALVSGPAAPLGPFPASGSVSVTTGMVNILAGAPMGPFRPYVGAGIGVANLNASNVMAGPLGPLTSPHQLHVASSWPGISCVSGISIKDPVGVVNNLTTSFQSVEAVLTLHLGQ